MAAGIPSPKTRALWTQRWRVMRDCGVKPSVARVSRSNLKRFRDALASVGRDAAEWPELNAHIGPSRWATGVPKTERAVWSRWSYRSLKGAGMLPAKAKHWCRSEVSYHYAMHCISFGIPIPTMPSQAKDKYSIVASKIQKGAQSWEE